MLTHVTDLESEILAGASSADVQWRSPVRGVITGIWLSTSDGDLVNRAGLGVKIYRRRRFETTGDDEREAFAPQVAMGGAGDAGPEWQDMLLPVDELERLDITLTNEGPNPLTPRILFRIDEDDGT